MCAQVPEWHTPSGLCAWGIAPLLLGLDWDGMVLKNNGTLSSTVVDHHLAIGRQSRGRSARWLGAVLFQRTISYTTPSSLVDRSGFACTVS